MKKSTKRALIIFAIYAIFDQTRAFSGIEITQLEHSMMLIVGNVLAVGLWWVLPVYLVYKTIASVSARLKLRSVSNRVD